MVVGPYDVGCVEFLATVTSTVPVASVVLPNFYMYLLSGQWTITLRGGMEERENDEVM